MKKIKVMLTVCCVCIACLLLLTACSAKLSAPSTFRVDPDTLLLRWNRVREAAAYNVTVDDTISITTRDNTYSLENLEPGEHIIRVQAITYGDDVENSEFSEFVYVREQETGLRYKLSPTRDSYELVGIGTASGDVVMEDYFRGKPVTSIGKAALRRCGRITSFVVGKNVKTIGENAFAGCAEMTSITIPEGVTSIGNHAFQNCSGLQNVTLPNSLETISDYMFSMCGGLKSITFGSNLKHISVYAFADCDALESIQLPDNVTTIGEYAFSGCDILGNVEFSTNLQKIEKYAFFNCVALNAVTFNDQIVEICDGAFQATGLTTVTLPDSVTKIGEAAFANCAALRELSLGAGLTQIGISAFAATPVIDEYEGDVIIVNDWILGVKNLEMENYTVPENIIGIASIAFYGHPMLQSVSMDNVKYIGQYAFSNCPKLWEMIIGDALLEIGESGFAYSANLTDVTLGNSLETIGSYAFYQCSRLEDSGIDLPKSVMTIGTSAFSGTLLFKNARGIVYVDDWVVDIKEDSALSGAFIKEGTRGIANYAFYNAMFTDGTLFIPDSVERIGYAAFYKNTSLMRLNMPANLKYISDFAFSDCQYLTFSDVSDTIIPYGCEYIGDSAFRNCQYLIGLTIPGSVKYVGNYAFKNCINLGHSGLKTSQEADPLVGEIVFDEGIEFMGDQVFYGCAGLFDVKLPDSLKELGNRAFYKCIGMESVTIGTGLTEIPAYTFYDCEALKEIIIPGNVRRIGSYSFRGCKSLANVVLCEGVEKVDDYAFFKADGVRYLTLADSVTSIGNFAFRGMDRLYSIYLSKNISYIGRMAFYGNNDATIYLEATEIPADWSNRWNASYLPVVYGAVLSEDNSHVVSWTVVEGGLENLSTFIVLSYPTRNGYTFAGWTTDQNGTVCEYEVLSDVPVGTTVYTIWTENVVEEIPEETPGESTEPTT